MASQGESEAKALANLREAVALHFKEPTATAVSRIETIEVEVGAT